MKKKNKDFLEDSDAWFLPEPIIKDNKLPKEQEELRDYLRLITNPDRKLKFREGAEFRCTVGSADNEEKK